MFFNGPLFWFLNGIIFVVIVFALKAFAEDKGWVDDLVEMVVVRYLVPDLLHWLLCLGHLDR